MGKVVLLDLFLFPFCKGRGLCTPHVLLEAASSLEVVGMGSGVVERAPMLLGRSLHSEAFDLPMYYSLLAVGMRRVVKVVPPRESANALEPHLPLSDGQLWLLISSAQRLLSGYLVPKRASEASSIPYQSREVVCKRNLGVGSATPVKYGWSGGGSARAGQIWCCVVVGDEGTEEAVVAVAERAPGA